MNGSRGIILGLVLCTGVHTVPVCAVRNSVGTMAINALSAVMRAIQTVLPSKTTARIVLGVIGGLTVRSLWTRYVTLGNIEAKINPAVLLYVDQKTRPLYAWMVGERGFETPAHIRVHYQEVKHSLAVACLAGHVDIFHCRTGVLVHAGNIYWQDVISTIDGEIARIRRMMGSIESYVGISIGGIHLFGIRKNFAQACRDLDIEARAQLRNTITVEQERQIGMAMTEAPGITERIILFFMMANPNYDKAYHIFWELDQRLGRLYAIKEAVVHAPINWNVALH